MIREEHRLESGGLCIKGPTQHVDTNHYYRKKENEPHHLFQADSMKFSRVCIVEKGRRCLRLFFIIRNSVQASISLSSFGASRSLLRSTPRSTVGILTLTSQLPGCEMHAETNIILGIPSLLYLEP
jgi:hypothetical protein